MITDFSLLLNVKGYKRYQRTWWGRHAHIAIQNWSFQSERTLRTFKTFRFGCAAMPRASFWVARRPIRLLLKKKKVSKALHYTPLWLMCFKIMKSTVLSKLSRGKREVDREGKRNIRGAHEPQDNPTVVASHADVLRGSSHQKNVREGG